MKIKFNNRRNRATIEDLLPNYTLILRRVGERWATGEIFSQQDRDKVFAFTFPTDIVTIEDAIRRCEAGIPLLIQEAERLFKEGPRYAENGKLKYEYRTYPR